MRVEKHASEMKTVRARTAREIINTSGFTGGLVVHVGPGDGAFTSELFANDRCVVQGLYSDGDLVGAARKKIAKQGLYGKVSVRHWDKDYLPYADNLVNLLVVAGPGDVSMDDVFMNEAMRVLAPLGSAFTKSGDSWARTVKPWPKEIDEWTHYLHGPDNNAVAQDKVVGLPRRVQWIGFPKFARSHDHLATVSAMVSA
ncbi:MAG: hypothetical protein KAR47_03045, partial [Planctomycetes bacterium]|nr:hypothetical protein [Planctomycetota bacterium]